jgi:hypothetical protein
LGCRKSHHILLGLLAKQQKMDLVLEAIQSDNQRFKRLCSRRMDACFFVRRRDGHIAREHVSGGTASADRKDFSHISTSIDLKLRIKRFWRQGQAKGRKWGSGTDRSSFRGKFLLVVGENRGLSVIKEI